MPDSILFELKRNKEIKMNSDERRYKQLVFSPFLIISFFQWKPDELLKIPIIENLSGWKIVNIDFSCTRYSFIITIYHPSFDIIPLGVDLPHIPFTLCSCTVEPY